MRVIPAVIRQHAEDAAAIHSIRRNCIRARHVRLNDISRFDERIAAHLDGLVIAGEEAVAVIDAGLAKPDAAAMFTACFLAIEHGSPVRLNRIYALAEAMPETKSGVVSAFGWAEKVRLRGIVSDLLRSPNYFLQLLGLSACAVQRVDAGEARDRAFKSECPWLRARALRMCGELGLREHLPACLRMISTEDSACKFWAAWSAVLLGNRGVALDALIGASESPGPYRESAFCLAVQAMDVEKSRAWLRTMAGNPANKSWLIEGSGIAGDPAYVPWLIRLMDDPKTARVAVEAFSLITGIVISRPELRGKPATSPDLGPNDNADDQNVEMDEYGEVPWPNQQGISKWWDANGSRFAPGIRYFLGAPLTRENCLKALKEGFQRQRILAAHYLCLLEPGSVLFEWRAPAQRQQKLLAAME